MLSDRVFVETTNDQVDVTLRSFCTPFRVASLVATGTIVAFGMLMICLAPLPLFVLGVSVAFVASTTVFIGVQWLVYGFERFTLAGGVLTYEWGIPSTGIGRSTKYQTSNMGPIQINTKGALGFTHQGQHVRVGKVCLSHEKLEYLDVLAAHLPAYLVTVPPLAQGDVYYPVEGKIPAAPSTVMAPSRSQPSLAPIRATTTPAEAHI